VTFPDFDQLDSSLIMIRWSAEEGRPLYSIGNMDPWAAIAILEATARKIERGFFEPRCLDDPEAGADEDGEEEED